MSKFFVGQMVRLVKAYHPENQGLEGRIVAMFDERESCIPGWPINCVVDAGASGDADHTDRLEPILPEGSAPSEYTFQQLMDNLQEVMA